MTPHQLAGNGQARTLQDYAGPPPENYERYFVPAIGAPLAAELVATAALQSGQRVVDLACGTGVVARLAAERVGPDGAVTGVDVNPGMLAVARSLPTHGAAIAWHEADAAASGLPDAAFDAALCQLGLQFFTDRAGALRETRRLLAPGGQIVVNTPAPSAMFEILEDSLAEHVSPAAANFVATVFSLSEPSELDRLLDHAGFADVVVSRSARTLHLPPPAEFLWQYVASTPLAPALAGLDERDRSALARDVATRWEQFCTDGDAMVLELEVVIAVGRR